MDDKQLRQTVRDLWEKVPPGEREFVARNFEKAKRFSAKAASAVLFPSEPPKVSPSEFLALQSIVAALVSHTAKANRPDNPREYVNQISKVAQSLIDGAPAELDYSKGNATTQMNDILNAVRFEKPSGMH